MEKQKTLTLKEEIKSIKQGRPPRKTKEERKADKEYKKKHAQKRRFFPVYKRYQAAVILMALAAIAFLLAVIVVDALPGDLTLIIISIMLGLLVLSSVLFSSTRKRSRIIGIVVAVLFITVTCFATGFMANTYAMLSKISDGGTQASGPQSKKVEVTQEPFNVYITGIDQWASEKGLDLERSDVNMLVTIHPVTKKILLTSIPRDTYVKLHTAQQMDKLTHTGVYGIDETINTVEDWLGIDINYYAKMNFTGARDIIDAMGGIDVYSPVEFRSSIKGYKYVKGWNHLRGKKAIYFARERKEFEGGDAIRVENQQRVMKAVIKKMTSSTTLLMHYGDIMDAAGDNLQTNMTTDEMRELVKMQITELAGWDVQTQKIEGEYDQDYVASLTQSMKFDIYRPSDESVKSCKDNINRIMTPSEGEIEEAKKGTSRSFVVNAVKRLITPQGDSEGETETTE